MTRLDNKGQSLVMFVLIVPILLLVLILVFDIGNAFVNKQELDNVNYLTIEYGLENIDNDNIETKLIDMINFNDLSINEIKVKVKDKEIFITIKKDVNGILAKGFKILTIESSYKGYFRNGKKVIERV